MIFTRVRYYHPDGPMRRTDHYSGHTATTRRQLAAWDTAVQAWRRIGATSSGVNVAAFHGYKLAERSWEFLTNLPGGPDTTAHGH